MADPVTETGGSAWGLIIALAIPVLLTISDIVHRLLVGMKINLWDSVFGSNSVLFAPFKGSGKGGGFGGFGGGGFGGGGASGGW